MTIRAVIIDDEKHSVETLRWKLEKICPEVEVVASFMDPTEGLDYLRSTPPDLLFLDISMPRLTGFDLLEEMGKVPFHVVFITAYDDFGIQAIKFSALDYLLKPVQEQELQSAIQKFKERNIRVVPSRQLEALFSNIHQEEKGLPGKIALASRERIEFVAPADIVLCSSDSNYTMVFMVNKSKRLISRTLKEFEEMLTPHKFFRVHHSHLINLQHVKEYVRSDGGYLVMSNSAKVPVSRSRKEELLAMF